MFIMIALMNTWYSLISLFFGEGVMTVKRLERYFPLVKLLAKKKFSIDEFKSIIHSLDNDTVKFICECCRNVISKRYLTTLKPAMKRNFIRLVTPHKSLLKYICRKRNNYLVNKWTISRKGYGLIIPILSTVLPLIFLLLRKRREKWFIIKVDTYKKALDWLDFSEAFRRL